MATTPLFLEGKKVETLRHLGRGVCTNAWEVVDRRYTGGTCVYAFTYKLDYAKEALSNIHHRNPHLPTTRRVGVGCYNGNWGVIYRMPKYNVLGNVSHDKNTERIFTTYSHIDNLYFSYDSLKDYQRVVNKSKKIPASVRHALCILGKAIWAEQKRYGGNQYLGTDVHNGNGAIDEEGNLILLDIFNVCGQDFGFGNNINVAMFDKVGLDISNYKQWLEEIKNAK